MRFRPIALVVILVGILTAPLAAEAQPAGKVYRIGLFHVGLDHVPPSLDGLRAGLKTLGYDSGTGSVSMVSSVMEGKNIRLDWRNLPDEEAARLTAQRFVQDRVDVIVAFEAQTVKAAKAATSRTPVVFLHVDDPVADGFINSLSRPGGNLTGLAWWPHMSDKRLQLFKELVPGLRRVLVLLDPKDPSTGRLLLIVRKAATALKLELVEREVTEPADSERVFGALQPGYVHGVFVVSPSLETNFPSLILRLASERRLPLPGPLKKWVAQGALFYYGIDYHAAGWTAAQYIDKILKGAKPADLPVEQPTKFELIINLKTAKALGLTIAPSLLLRADQVIE